MRRGERGAGQHVHFVLWGLQLLPPRGLLAARATFNTATVNCTLSVWNHRCTCRSSVIKWIYFAPLQHAPRHFGSLWRGWSLLREGKGKITAINFRIYLLEKRGKKSTVNFDVFPVPTWSYFPLLRTFTLHPCLRQEFIFRPSLQLIKMFNGLQMWIITKDESKESDNNCGSAHK